MCKATTFDLLSLFLSSASHDMDHPGHNNSFESKTHSKLATLYNDQAVLENHHAASFFFLVEDDECNIFKQFSIEDFNRIRKYIIDNILYTDMSKHFSFLNEIKGMTQ
jgi:3'5'-cyclic nucleotide phosphodiesterase